MKNYLKKVRYVSYDEICKHLDFCRNFRKLVELDSKDVNGLIGLNAFYADSQKYFKLTYKSYNTGVCTYIFDKSTGNSEDHPQVTPSVCYRVLCRYVGRGNLIRVVKDKEEAPFSAKPFLWKNKKYENTRNECWCYDMNSAYSYAMIQQMPDTSKPPQEKFVEAGEIGFDTDGNRMTKGYSMYVFKLIDSPFVRFVENWYSRKKNAKNLCEKRKAKEYLNFVVGYLQNVNPYLRAQMVGIANDTIKSLMDKDTVYCNTDSIVSLRPRDDLKMGRNLGEFKLEHHGLFAYKGFNYQWGLGVPSVRGVTKTYFNENWDILKDPLPVSNNPYIFDKKRGEMLCLKN